ncbi:MAG TPA: hypothetical protein DDX75_17915 [Phycisphaerales bacterium]|nr:hypothetical protein [Phycisphaerales bacterium]
MNSYVIQTFHGKVIVIDGGFAEDASYLKGFLGALGNKVHAWFISHQHVDHIEALTTILKKPQGLEIDKVFGSFLDEEWIKVYEQDSLKTASEFNRALHEKEIPILSLKLGQTIKIDGITIKILGIKNSEITTNAINNSSVVMKFWDKHKSICFLGDIGVEGGRKLLNSKFKKELKSDYVQMAHHGQAGVEEDFYKAVSPKYCIWPTPLWLWENNNGGGDNSGNWKTLEVRSWINKLKIKKHYCLFEGLIKIY